MIEYERAVIDDVERAVDIQLDDGVAIERSDSIIRIEARLQERKRQLFCREDLIAEPDIDGWRNLRIDVGVTERIVGIDVEGDEEVSAEANAFFEITTWEIGDIVAERKSKAIRRGNRAAANECLETRSETEDRVPAFSGVCYEHDSAAGRVDQFDTWRIGYATEGIQEGRACERDG